MNNDEITLKELILKVQDYFNEVLSKWWFLLVLCITSIVIGYYQHVNTEVTYSAKLKFVIEGQKGQGGGLAKLLGAATGVSKSVNPYKVLEVVHGSELFLKVIKSKNDEGMMIANQILDIYNLQKDWEETSSTLDGFRFTENLNIDDSNVTQQKAFRTIQKLTWGSDFDRSEAMCTLLFDEETGLFTLSAKTRSESLSLQLTRTIYREIKQFFEEEVFSNKLQLAAILDSKTDSLRTLRNTKIREATRFENRNRQSLSPEVTAMRSILIFEQTALNTAYGEVLKSKEMTDIELKDQQPLFMTIETPYRPLLPFRIPLSQRIIYAIMIGLILGSFIILSRKIYKDIMST